MASTGAKRSRCLKRLADTLEWGCTGDSSGCVSSAHSTLWPAVLSTDKQLGSRDLPPKVSLVINNKHTCQVVWREWRWHHHKVGKEWGRCLCRFALNPALPRRPCSGHPTWLHHCVQLRPPHLHVSCPHARDGWLLVSSRKSVVSAEQLALHTMDSLHQHSSKCAAGSKRACQHLPEEQLARSESRCDASCADGKRRNSCPLLPPPEPH